MKVPHQINIIKILQRIKWLLNKEAYISTYMQLINSWPKGFAYTIENLHKWAFKIMFYSLFTNLLKNFSSRLVEVYCITNILTEKQMSRIYRKTKDGKIIELIERDSYLKKIFTKNENPDNFTFQANYKDSLTLSRSELESKFGFYWWHANEDRLTQELDNLKGYLYNSHQPNTESNIRILPSFTSHFGHLGFLFLYLNFYRQHDPGRTVILPGGTSANQYLLDLICRRSPIEIRFAEDLTIKNAKISECDFLNVSRTATGFYRTESSCAAGSEQLFPEYTISQEFKLALTEEENAKGMEILSKHLGRKIHWFSLLHIRGPKNGLQKFAQARDASVLNYNLMCKAVTNAGGLVVRNGSRNFVKLPDEFEAFDYAHSSIKSPFMDVWLNANCAFWIGNMNGASVVPIAFGKVRLITDAWYIDENGPPYDHYVPKKLFKNGKLLSDRKAVREPIARCMNRKWYPSVGCELEDLNPNQLLEVFKEFMVFVVQQELLAPSNKWTNNLMYNFKDRPNKMNRIEY